VLQWRGYGGGVLFGFDRCANLGKDCGVPDVNFCFFVGFSAQKGVL